MDALPHVLVVEDTPIALMIMKENLMQEGCTVDQAMNGEEALQKARTTHYDLILMDIGLGEGLDGFEVTLAIKKSSRMNRNTPIFAVSAHNEKEYRERANECGMAGYYTKPFTLEDVKVIIKKIKVRRN